MSMDGDVRQLGKHLSKSAHELRHNSLAHRTQSLFTSIKERWSRKKKREEEGQSTDYAADNSSDQSTPRTQSPRHQSRQSGSALASRPPEGTWRVSPDNARPDPSSIAQESQLDDDAEFYFDEDAEERKRLRESALRQHSFFTLKIHLKNGINLVAKDKSGTSDPYVKFKIQGRLLYRSKTVYRDLNPNWDEHFTIPITDPFAPVHVKVFDYDWGFQDDFMGSAYIDLTKYELNVGEDVTLELEDREEQCGELNMRITLTPKTQEDKEEYFQKNSKISDANRRLKSQIWSSVVTIVLIEGKNIVLPVTDSPPDSYAKFRLGNEKYKSHVAYKTCNPNWLEQFDLHLYDDQAELEVTVWHKAKPRDDYIGKCTIDLSELEREKTQRLRPKLEDSGATIFILLTISGTTASETISDLTTYEENPREVSQLHERYSLFRSFNNFKDVGHLTVRVYKARGLASADLGGKSDPFCVLELVNARLQTQTEYKTLCPSWQKIFTFAVKDITSVLEVTVYDEDRDHKVEFLGKVAIPLLRIKNNEKRWYALKDKKLYSRAKGNYPQIQLELSVVWNPVRACIRTLNPKEQKFMQPEMKFRRQVFVRNVMRLKAIIMWFIEISKFIQSCFEWESTVQSTIALIVFVLGCYYFEPYMIPAAMLLIFLKCYVVKTVTGTGAASDDEDEPLGDDEDEEEDKEKEEKKSLKERLQAIQEVTQTVQNAIGYIASLGESVTNTFNFTVPFLSYLAVALLATSMIVLYWIPIRYMILMIGVNKFARKLIRPHTIPNNEVLDLLSRVPDNEDLICYRELRIQPACDNERRRDTKKKKLL